MPSIRSIIIFNGGSCGDFLKSVCLEQIYKQPVHDLINNGSTIQFKNNYFKNFCESMYQESVETEIDYTKTSLIENTHFYLDYFNQLNSLLFYIDYPDSAQSMITQCYIEKRMNSDIEKFRQHHIKYIPESIQYKINTSNIVAAFDAQNKKNLAIWRQKIQSIPLYSLFNFDSLLPIVEKLCRQSLTNIDLLQESQKKWLDANPRLSNYFRSSI